MARRARAGPRQAIGKANETIVTSISVGGVRTGHRPRRYCTGDRVFGPLNLPLTYRPKTLTEMRSPPAGRAMRLGKGRKMTITPGQVRAARRLLG